MSQVELEFTLVVGLTIGAIVSLVMGLILILAVSKFGRENETYFQLGQMLLTVGILCIIGVVFLYFFYPSYVSGLFKQAFRIGK